MTSPSDMTAKAQEVAIFVECMPSEGNVDFIAAALSEAREQGRREGLKRAAEIVRKGMEFEPKKAAAGFLGEASRSIVSELRRNVLGIARDAILSEAEGA